MGIEDRCAIWAGVRDAGISVRKIGGVYGGQIEGSPGLGKVMGGGSEFNYFIC